MIAICQIAGGTYNGNLDSKLQVLRGASFVASQNLTFDSTEQTGFAIIDALDPAAIDTRGNYDGFGTAAVICDLVVRDAITRNEVARYEFGIRKPPIVLVHGYNADAGTWGDEFKTILNRARGSNFVLPIDYGTANDNRQNTDGSFDELSSLLNTQLRSAIENSQSPNAVLQSSPAVKPELRNWTFTRYDAIGHSQGGVLLRLLCSGQLIQQPGGGSTAITAFQTFRNEANHNAGRFRRVVTIGSPHAGSTLAHLAIRMREEGVKFGFPLNRMSKEEQGRASKATPAEIYDRRSANGRTPVYGADAEQEVSVRFDCPHSPALRDHQWRSGTLSQWRRTRDL